MSADPRFLLIKNYDLWSHLTDEEYDELNIMHRYIESRKGEYIYFEAFNHNKLYFLKKGFIRIGYINEAGEEIIKEILQKGEIFGQFTLEKNNLRGEFAQAYKGDVSLCAFSVEDFERLLRRKPEIALKYTRQVGHKLIRIQNNIRKKHFNLDEGVALSGYDPVDYFIERKASRGDKEYSTVYQGATYY